MKRTLISTFALAGVVGLGLSTFAAAEGERGHKGKHGEMRAEMLQKYDANSDGKLDETERDAARLAKFAEIDTNGNGSISKDEVTAHQMAKMAERIDAHFAAEDTNNDGAISADEFGSSREARHQEWRAKHEARRAEVLEKFDADGDGELSETERAAAKAAGFGRHKKGHGHRDHSGSPE